MSSYELSEIARAINGLAKEVSQIRKTIQAIGGGVTLYLKDEVTTSLSVLSHAAVRLVELSEPADTEDTGVVAAGDDPGAPVERTFERCPECGHEWHGVR